MNVFPRIRAGLLALFLIFSGLRAAEVTLVPLSEPDPARDERVAWHEEARFGCFVHWGVYSALAGEWNGKKGGTYSEHIMRQLKIPRQVYLEQIAAPFNPVHFDADAWVKLMHDAGMRYLIITAKHHDGFAMYPSKVSDYNLTTVSAFKRDPLRELSDACKKYGLRFGFYYSHAFDWEHPDAPGNDWDYDNPGGDLNLHGGRDWFVAHPELIPKAQHYVDQKAIPQIKELLTTYHPDILWFDTPHKLPPEENLRILRAVRETDPHVVVNGRLVANYGDYRNTADRPAEVPYTEGHWEGIPTTNESYGYSKYDHSHKPPEHFVRLLAKIAAKGGNMLMNIGPRGDGTIDPADSAILAGIGGWMQKNGESIYGTDRTPLPMQNWGQSTRREHRLYLHVFTWPASGRLTVSGLKTDVVKAYLLSAPERPLEVRRASPLDVDIALPSVAPDPWDSVIALDCAGAIETDPARLLPDDEVTPLHVFDGQLHGSHIRYADGKTNRDTTTEWTRPDSGVDWKIRVAKPTRFRVSATYAATKPDRAGEYEIAVAAQSLHATVKPTEKDTAFITDRCGELDLPAGEFTVTVRPTKIEQGELMRLRALEFAPVDNR